MILFCFLQADLPTELFFFVYRYSAIIFVAIIDLSSIFWHHNYL
jgi:hypothetical protein